MNADREVHAAIAEFRQHMGNARLTLRQKRGAFKGLCHICFQRLTEIGPMTELRLRAVIHEWSYLRAPLEPNFPVERLGLALEAVGQTLRAASHGTTESGG